MKVKAPIKSATIRAYISTPEKAASFASSRKAGRKESLTCLYLNSKNILLKQETFSLPQSGKGLSNIEKIFVPAATLKAAGVVLLRNSASVTPAPTCKDKAIVRKLVHTGKRMTVNVADFIVVAKNGYYSFLDRLSGCNQGQSYAAESHQLSLFDSIEYAPPPQIKKDGLLPEYKSKIPQGYFEIQNRRFLGNKYRLLPFIEEVVKEKCGDYKSFCDVFSGTGVVGARFNRGDVRVISNDVLYSNFVSLQTFLGAKNLDLQNLEKKIAFLNSISADGDNYFSSNYGNTFFSLENARKIGETREEIDRIAETTEEKYALLTALMYATDKVANTVGHYDAFRKNLDSLRPLKLLTPYMDVKINRNNEVYNEDANSLVKKIEFDVLYMDPPYNSRQYCDAYHLLENLAAWEKPEVYGKAKKMDRAHLKSGYCLKSAPVLFRELVENAQCKHILVSYNNTGDSRDGRSNARISDEEMFRALSSRGKVEIFTRDYKAFTAGKSEIPGNAERIFYCKVNR